MDDVTTIYREKQVGTNRRILPEGNRLYEMAYEYHQTRLGGEMQECLARTADADDAQEEIKSRPLIIENDTNLFARCITYFQKNRNHVAMAISNDGSTIAHGLDDQIVLIPCDHTKKRVTVLDVESNDTAQIMRSFVACCLYADDSRTTVYGVDNNARLHEWDVSCEQDEKNPEINYHLWAEKMPENITAMRMTRYGPAIFHSWGYRLALALKESTWNPIKFYTNAAGKYCATKTIYARGFKETSAVNPIRIDEQTVAGTQWYEIYSADYAHKTYQMGVGERSKQMYIIEPGFIKRFAKRQIEKYDRERENRQQQEKKKDE
jgi:hypothetical protein